MAEGQYLGPKATYRYISDSGAVYLVTADVTLATLPGTGLVAATTANSGDADELPKRFQVRRVYWQGVLNNRLVRKAIICNSAGTLYQAGISQSVTIDGTVGTTTGRVGERQTFRKLAPAA